MNVLPTQTFFARRTIRLSALAATLFLTLGVASLVETVRAQDASSGAYRTWTFQDGDGGSALLLKIFRDRAKNDAESVALRTPDGSIVAAALAELLDEDQKFVENYRENKILSGGATVEKPSRFRPSRPRDVVVVTEPGRKTSGAAVRPTGTTSSRRTGALT